MTEKENILKNEVVYEEFEKSALPHMNLLYNYSLKMTGSEDDAADLVQETYLKAYRFYDKYEQGTNIKAWLFRILKNSFINEYRKNIKGPEKVDYDDIQNFYENIKPDDVESTHIEQDIYSNTLNDDVIDALNNLPDDFRTVVILSDIENYTYEEIADFVDIPVGTVRSRLHRARKVLYSGLHDYAAGKGILNNGDKD